MAGESRGNGNANAYHAISRGDHPRATAAVVAAKRENEEGNAGTGGGGGSFEEELRLTVYAKGRRWSSVCYVNETLEEFAAAFARDVRRLAFRDNDDSIQRLQLEYYNGSKPVDLDVDAYGDFIIKMGYMRFLAMVKQHLGIVESSQPTFPPQMHKTGTPKQYPESECTPHLTNAIARNCNDSVAAPSSSPSPFAPSAARKFPFLDNEPPCSAGLTTNPRASKNYIPPESPSLQFPPVERTRSFPPDYVASASANLLPLPRSSDKLSMGGDELDNELPNGGSELVFQVHRRSKMRLHGVGTRYLKMSDISALFHLNLTKAAEELEVSQTTLKKACRFFGRERWPGRKVRSLQRKMQEHLHESVVGQGAGLEESNEAYMRSEACKLQQELNQLVHGTPAQVTQKMHPPSVRAARSYKRLSSPRERSEYPNSSRHDTGSPNKRVSGHAPPTTRKHRKAAKENHQRKGPYYIELSD